MKPETQNPLTDFTGQLMIMASHRYCLGRQTYIVGCCIEWLLKNKGVFNDQTKSTIVRDTVEALQDNAAGSKFDAIEWKSFAETLWKEMSPEEQLNLKRNIEYRKKPWPLED